MKTFINARSAAAFLITICLLVTPMAVFAKGDKHFKQGLKYEQAQQWEKAAQSFALAIAADPAHMEYQLHYRRAVFNASQSFMIKGRALAEQRDYAGAYNAFRQAYGYDPVNELALSEMERMLRLQREKDGLDPNMAGKGNGNGASSPEVKVSPTAYQPDNSTQQQQEGGQGGGGTPSSPGTRSPGSQDPNVIPTPRTEQLRVISYSGDLKSFLRSLADQLNINVVFDRQSFQQPRTIDINLRDVTTAQALDFIFLQEGLFFQRLNRRTILVADQTRRMQYQQLVIRTFYLANVDPADAQKLIGAAIPPQAGRQTIVIPDKATNSLTVRDTPENIRLIGDLIQSIDKDRAEVVMDVNIYEVLRTDLLQLGNQIGDGASVFSLGSGSPLAITSGSRQVAAQLLPTIPTSYGAALVIPAQLLTAFQRKLNTRLVASTQIHAFNGEESQARIGQRVPVQTAQTYPFGSTNTGTNTGVNPGVGFAGGFPVFNYEPTGLTLKFTPQVFPNLDVQVKMSIESKDVLNPGSPTPTFTERTISGTARIQNNRTMMLASVAQTKHSTGRAGLPILGLIPVLGRLFTSPIRDDQQMDIVMAVTPRVLRAPTVSPADEKMRPSGTLQTPTTGSLEAMIQEADREDQLAAARLNQNNATAQIQNNAAQPQNTASQTQSSTVSQPQNNVTAQNSVGQSQNNATTVAAAAVLPARNNIIVPISEIETPPAFVPAPKSLMNSANTSNGASDASAGGAAQTTVPVKIQPRVQQHAPASVSTVVTPTARGAASATTLSNTPTAASTKQPTLPRSLDVSATIGTLTTQPTVALDTVPARTTQTTPAAETRAPFSTTGVNEAFAKPAPSSAVELRLLPEQQEMRVGEKRRLALILKTDAPLGLAVITLRFDPRAVAVRGVSIGNLFAGVQGGPPTLTQSVNAVGVLLVSVAPPPGALMTGAGVLIFVDIEATGAGDSTLSFDKDNMQLIASDGRSVLLQFVPARIMVKQ